MKKEAALIHDGYPARAYELDCGSLLLQGRYILAGSRRYHVAALISKKILAEREQEVTRFIDSFEVSK